MYQSTGVPRGG